MNLYITTALTPLTLLLLSATINAAEIDGCDFHGRAFFYESGADRMMWSTEIEKDGSTVVIFNENLLDFTKQDIQKNLILRKKDMQKICNLFQEEKYLKLPRDINKSPAPLHAPWFVIEFKVNEESHRVELYDPKGAKDIPETNSFSDLWNKIGDMMPINPPNPKQYMK